MWYQSTCAGGAKAGPGFRLEKREVIALPNRRVSYAVLMAVVLGGLLGLSPARALAVTCASVCGSNNPCTIGSTITLDPGDVFDCTAYDQVIIGNFGTLKVTNGSFTFLGNDLDVVSGGKIQVVATESGKDIGVVIELAGDLDLYGKVLANSAWGGGTIAVSTGGFLQVAESGTNGIEANGTAAAADGGDISLTSTGNVVILCPIQANGDGGSGTNSGGTITIESEGSILTSFDGLLTATARKSEGGTITLVADGDVTTGASIDAFGTQDTGDGGLVAIQAGNAITVGGAISVRGGVNVMGGDAYGGSVQLEAGCGGIQLNADIDARGGEGGGLAGGSLSVDSVGDVTIAAGVQILSQATQSDGVGGDIEIKSEGKLSLGANILIDARGDSIDTNGEGASVALEGCTIDVAAGVTIDVTGYAGGLLTLTGGTEPGTAPLPSGSTQPVVIDETAVLKASGNSTDFDGEIEVIVRNSVSGECATQPGVACELDTDCTVGCSTDECIDVNPDTDGVESQFDLTPTRIDATRMVSCVATCP